MDLYCVAHLLSFQSLFSWMNFSKWGTVSQYRNILVVSILVLLDEFLEEFASWNIGLPYQFQSLFSWMNFSKCGISRLMLRKGDVSILVLLDEFLEDLAIFCCRVISRVSILVLLDEFLEGSRGDLSFIFQYSFNPCSLG